MAFPTADEALKRRSFEDDRAEVALQRIRQRIRARNFPKERSPLRWRKITDRIIRSHDDRFQVEQRGEGEATRYFAFLLPATVIGHRLLTPEQAKEICEQHASPLPLEVKPPAVAPAASLTPEVFHVEREPGCDDE